MTTFARDELIASQLEYTTIDPSKCITSTLLEIGSKDLVSNSAVDVGLWEHPIGESTDIEVEEVFVVLAGTGTVYIEDGSNRTLKLAPGTVGVLQKGTPTRWVIDSPLRKVYILPKGRD